MESPHNENARAVHIFDESAKSYASKYANVSVYANAFQFFADTLPTNASVLELACGPGNATKFLLDLRPDLNWRATDLSPNMLEAAKAQNIPAHFELRDARNPTAPGELFTGIFAAFLLPYLNDLELAQLLQKCHAALMPSGSLFLSFMEAPAALSGWETGSSGQRMYLHYRTIHDVAQAAQFGFTLMGTHRYPIPTDRDIVDAALIFKRNSVCSDAVS